jgi:hypothetical protein
MQIFSVPVLRRNEEGGFRNLVMKEIKKNLNIIDQPNKFIVKDL